MANDIEYGTNIYHYLMGDMEPPEAGASKEAVTTPVGTYRVENDKVRLVNLLAELTKESPS